MSFDLWSSTVPIYPNWSTLVWSIASLSSGPWNSCLPNEDFGKSYKRWSAHFREALFRWFEYSIWATNDRKVNRKSAFPLSSFGDHKIAQFLRTTRVIITVANKTFALSRLGKKWYEKWWKGTVITTKALILGCNECLCCYRRILSTFFIPFSSEAL